LVEALGALRNVEGIDFVYFNEADVIRHELVKKIVNAYRRHRGTGETDTKG
jgi:phosphate starvation-inducible protein PhoH and related proteins